MDEEVPSTDKGRVFDLVVPVIVLILICVFALLYVGGFFGVDIWGGVDNANNFVGAFGNTDETVGLPLGGLVTLVFVVIYFVATSKKKSRTIARKNKNK